MSRHSIFVVAVVVIGLGGYWAYESYQEQQRMQALENLFTGEECDSCAARKASLTKKKAERDAKEAEQKQVE